MVPLPNAVSTAIEEIANGKYSSVCCVHHREPGKVHILAIAITAPLPPLPSGSSLPRL